MRLKHDEGNAPLATLKLRRGRLIGTATAGVDKTGRKREIAQPLRTLDGDPN
jgi:hypothetical protein